MLALLPFLCYWLKVALFHPPILRGSESDALCGLLSRSVPMSQEERQAHPAKPLQFSPALSLESFTHVSNVTLNLATASHIKGELMPCILHTQEFRSVRSSWELPATENTEQLEANE